MELEFPWCGIFQFPGKKACRFGTVRARDRREAIEKLEAAWTKTMPIAPPDFEPEKGVLVFYPGKL